MKLWVSLKMSKTKGFASRKQWYSGSETDLSVDNFTNSTTHDRGEFLEDFVVHDTVFDSQCRHACFTQNRQRHTGHFDPSTILGA